MIKHTPGPWYILGGSGCGGLVATTSFGLNIHGADFCINENAKANAILIAAAPDLLATLEVFLERYEDLPAGESAKIDNARALIARAKGKSV